MRKRTFEIIAIAGAVLTIQSVVWEQARMKPDYRFLVDPWSFRGWESIHGTVFTIVGVLTLLSVLAVIWKKSEDVRVSGAIVVGMVISAVVVAAIFAGRDVTVTFNFFIIGLLAAATGIMISRLIREFVDVPFVKSGLGSVVVFGGSVLVADLILALILGDKSIEMPMALGMLLLMALLGALSFSARPRELAANRMLMFSSIVAGGAIGTSAGALRSTLRRFQEIPAEYKDIQVTWGYFLANIGMVLVFIGAVAMWAKRRDRILNAQRVRSQRAAAEESAAEIQAALESAADRS